jgi:anti-sigma factor RsiW
MSHATQEDLLRFTKGQLSEDATSDLYAHLAECGRCVERVRAIKVLSADFESAWERWLEHHHEISEIHFPEGANATSWAVGAEAPPPVYEIAARVVLDATKKIGAIASKGLSEWMLGGRQYAFAVQHRYAGVADPTGGGGPSALLTEGADLLAEGRAEEAVAKFDQVIAAHPRAMESSEVAVTDESDERIATFHIDSKRRTLTVLMHSKKHRTRTWFAVLATPDGEVIDETRLAPVPGADYLLGEFVGVGSGELVVAIREG